eukprot:scaffold24036_cov94-Cyclotella_meneghiniana.AAC.4
MGCIMQVVLPLLLAVSVYNIALTNAQAGNEDYYCGVDFFRVTEECALPCPSGEDSECSNVLGDDYACFYFTGCANKIANGFVPASRETSAPTSKPVAVVVETPVPTSKPIEVAVETPAPVTAPPTPKPIDVAVETPAPVTAALSLSPMQAEATQAPSSQPTTSISVQDQLSDTNTDYKSATPTAAPGVDPMDDPPSSNAAACEYIL